MLALAKKIFNPLSLLQSSAGLVLIAMIFLGLEFNIPSLFQTVFNSHYDLRKLGDMLFFMIFTFLLFFVIPIGVSKFLYIKSLKELGLRLPENIPKTIFWMISAILFLIPLMVFFGHQKQFQVYYAFDNHSLTKFIFFQLIIFPLYYFFEEFFFRGFLLLNLWEKVRWHSFWITDIIFTFAHLTKPIMEVIIALPAGIILAFLTIQTRSIYPAIFVHYLMGIAIILAANQII